MGVLDYVKDRIGNRGALTKTPRDEEIEDLTSGYKSPDLDDFPPVTRESSSGPDLADYAAPSVSEVSQMEPSAFTSKLSPEAKRSKVLKDISEDNFEDAFKRDKKAIDAALEPITSEKGTILPKAGTEEDYMTMKIPSDEKPYTKPLSGKSEPSDAWWMGSSKPESETLKAEVPKVDIPSTPDVSKIKEATVEKEKPPKKSKWDIFKENIKGTDDSINEMEYARRGGYTEGMTKAEILAEIESLKKRNEATLAKIKALDDELVQAKKDKQDLKDQLKQYRAGSTERLNIDTELTRLDREITKLENRRIILVSSYDETVVSIKKYRMLLLRYDQYVEIGKSKPSAQRKAIGQKLQNIAAGSQDVQFMDTSARLVKSDWFGAKGFMKQPFKQDNITKSAVEPVKVATRNLDAVTRSTGGSVARSMIDVTKVSPSRNIAPLGVPGTVAGAKQRFEYDIPAKRITPADVTTNINRDLMPSIFSPPKQMQAPVQVQQVMQQDGTVIEVPVQQRKRKLFTISVNRFGNGKIGDNGVRKVNVGSVVTGVEKFRPFKIIKLDNKDQYACINKVGRTESCYSPTNLNISPSDVGQSRSLKAITIGQRPQIELGLRTPKTTGFTIGSNGSSNVIDTVKTDRKSKMSAPKVNMKAALKISGNINKFLLKKKTK